MGIFKGLVDKLIDLLCREVKTLWPPGMENELIMKEIDRSREDIAELSSKVDLILEAISGRRKVKKVATTKQTNSTKQKNGWE